MPNTKCNYTNYACNAKQSLHIDEILAAKTNIGTRRWRFEIFISIGNYIIFLVRLSHDCHATDDMENSKREN